MFLRAVTNVTIKNGLIISFFPVTHLNVKEIEFRECIYQRSDQQQEGRKSIGAKRGSASYRDFPTGKWRCTAGRAGRRERDSALLPPPIWSPTVGGTAFGFYYSADGTSCADTYEGDEIITRLANSRITASLFLFSPLPIEATLLTRADVNSLRALPSEATQQNSLQHCSHFPWARILPFGKQPCDM